jgi:hypothetical protein
MIFLPFLIASPQATAPEDENLWNVLLLNSAEYNLRQVRRCAHSDRKAHWVELFQYGGKRGENLLKFLGTLLQR